MPDVDGTDGQGSEKSWDGRLGGHDEFWREEREIEGGDEIKRNCFGGLKIGQRRSPAFLYLSSQCRLGVREMLSLVLSVLSNGKHSVIGDNTLAVC
jgi:hypothetical protein